MISSANFKKTAFVATLILVLLGPSLAPFAQSFSFPERYDMVAIVVEQGLYEDSADYNGLTDSVSGPISKTTLKSRVDRYAIDIQTALPGTRAVVIQADRFEKPENIAAVLERLYFEGDPREPTRTAYLKGIVVVGEVPLPVVNKNGNRFISLFPYTDFENKVYFWNEESRDWKAKLDNLNPQPEIWHGVIRPPLSTQTQDGKELLASYFDKNHLYHLGDPYYAKFDKKIFFQDFPNELKNLNPTAYKSYLNFLQHQDDVAYMRYTKQLFADLSAGLEEEMKKDEEQADAAIAQLQAAGIPFDTSVPSAGIPGVGEPQTGGGTPAVNKNLIPDIMTKIGKMSDNLMFRFSQVFTKYPNLLNDFVKYTGRYATVDSAVNLITAKDQYTISYLKAVNEMVEAEIDRQARELSTDIPFSDIKLKVQSGRRWIDGKLEVVPSGIITISAPEVEFVNYTPAFSNMGRSFGPRRSGNSINAVTKVEDCIPYRGSKGISKYSKLVEINRALNVKTSFDYDAEEDITSGRTPAEKAEDYQCHFEGRREACEGYEHFAGCFDEGSALYTNPASGAQVCFPEHATDPVLDPAGTREVAGLPPANFDNYNSCLDFREKEQYTEYLKSVDDRLENIDDEYVYDRDPAKNRDEKIRELRSSNLEPKDKHPNNIPMFSGFYIDTFNITFGDILRGLGWDPAADPNGWREAMARFFSTRQESVVTVPLNHPQIVDVQISFSRPFEKWVSSMLFHKEPSIATLNAQAKNLITSDLPVDNPRYVTFRNREGNVSRLDYPDIFKAESFEKFIEQLSAAQNQINAVPIAAAGSSRPQPVDPETGQPVFSSLSCTDCLTNLISDLPEISQTPANADTAVSRANRSKILDAINWKSLDIDSKHEYLNENYLDFGKNAYVGESANGYEMAYFNGEGDGLDYGFSLSNSLEEEDDPAIAQWAQELAKEVLPAYKDDPKNPFDDAPPEDTSNQGGYDLFSWKPPPISPWWERMKEWAESLKKTYNEFKFGKSQEDFYGNLEEENKKALEDIQNESSEVAANLLKADKLNLSKIARIELFAESNVVSAGKKFNVVLKLKDKNGDLVNDEFAKVTLEVNGGARFSRDMQDADAAKDGFQVVLMSGSEAFSLVAPELPAEMKISASVAADAAPEIKAQLPITVLSDAKLGFETQTTAAVANGSNEIRVKISAQDGSGKLLDGANTLVNIGLSDEEMGRLSVKQLRLESGSGEFGFYAGKRKGQVVINAVSSMLDSGQIILNLLPGPPVRLGLTSDSEMLASEVGASVKINAALFDKENNLVDTVSGTKISFRISDATANFGNLALSEATAASGIASTLLLPKKDTGPVNIIAEAQGISPASIKIKAVKKFGSGKLAEMNVSSLTAALLGAPAGDISQDNYLGGWFTMKGKTQAAVSLTSQPKQYKKLFEVSYKGGISLPDPAAVSVNFLPANNFTMVLRDNSLKLDLAQITLFSLKEGQFDITQEQDPDKLGDGIYIRDADAKDKYEVDKVKGALRVVSDESEKIEIQTNGYIRIFDNNFKVKPADGDFLKLQIYDRDVLAAEIFFVQRFNKDVRLQEEISDAPGIYVKKFKLPPFLYGSPIFGGNSSADPAGFAVFDKREEVRGPSSPGFSFNSLEDSLDRMGTGFTQDNKFALLFAAGEMFGEANRPYASDIGIVLGDPTVKLDNKDTSGFSQDTGKFLYASDAEITGILDFDYNTDGFDDILIVRKDGKIRLMQNNGGYNYLKDQGFLFEIKNGIQDLAKIDFNNDSQIDLAIAGKDSCRKGETCIDIYENRSGAFSRRNLRIPQKDEVITLKAQDMNSDGYADLIFADTSGDIKILYNRSGEFEEIPQVVGNTGLRVDPAKNLVSSIALNYSGMPQKNEKDPISLQKYKTMELKEPNTAAAREGFGDFFPSGSGAQISIDQSYKYTAYDFIYADQDASSFALSTKTAQDLNGGVVKAGDRIRYTVVLNNTAASARSNVKVSDSVSAQLAVEPSSIKCADCAEGEFSFEKLDGDEERPYLFKFSRVPTRSLRTFTYDAVFEGSSETSEKIKLSFGNQFEDEDAVLAEGLKADRYPDIAVTKEGNATGRVRYFYTAGIDDNGRLLWNSALSSAPRPETPESFAEKTGIKPPTESEVYNYPTKCMFGDDEETELEDKPDICKQRGGTPEPRGPSAASTGAEKDLATKDSDGDGLQDALDDIVSGDINGGLDKIADLTSSAVSKLTCSSGCIAMPMNMSFLTPGFFSIFGVPVFYDIGLPVFGWGAPNVIPTWPPTPHMTTAGGRFYVSPTLTGGVGFSLCLGPYASPKNCFSFGLNPLSPGICDKINNSVSSAMSAANDAIGKVNEGVTVSMGSGGAGTGASGSRAEGTGLGNYSLGSYETPVVKSKNKKVPGFPSFITEWWSGQMAELMDKVVTVPDLYLIYPSGDSLIGSVVPTEYMSRTGNVLTNLLSYLNSMPILDIETEEVLFKIPLPTRSEIERFKNDARQWIADEMLELDNWRQMMGCAGASTDPLKTAGDPEVCKVVDVQMNGFIKNISASIKALDEWILFPKKILQYRAVESYYIGQIIDYLDTIINFTGGWIKRNTARVNQWQKAVRQIKTAISTWKAMLDVMVEYNESCDGCKTERYSLKDLILKLFIAIPSPPIIPLPKMPDIVVDVSKIQAGLKIKWPDIKFQAVPFTLPSLPRIKLSADLTVPKFSKLIPDYAIPKIPSPPQLPQLPALPALNLPKLPDLPPPPKFPSLPGSLQGTISVFKKIIKILCIIRLGLVPTDEMLLKTRIEEITARGLSPVLPIDTLFSIQSPTISPTYVDQLKLTSYINLQFDLDYVLDFVQSIADESNDFSTDLSKGITKFSEALSTQLNQNAPKPSPVDLDLNKLNPQRLNYAPADSGLVRELSAALGTDATELVKLGLQFKKGLEDMNALKEKTQREAALAPKSITLNVLSEKFTPGKNKTFDIDENDFSLPFQKKLKEYRDNLASYVEDTEQMARNYDLGGDLDDFGNFISGRRSAFAAPSLKKFIAAENFEEFEKSASGAYAGAGEKVKIGSIDFEDIDFSSQDKTEQAQISRLLALAPALPPKNEIAEKAAGGGVGEIRDIGIFYIDGNGQSKRLVNYTLEADSPSKLADIDLEADGDTDKIYSYGQNVFVKQNAARSSAEDKPVFRPVDVEIWTVFELLPKGTSPNNARVISETSRQSVITFEKPAMEDLAGYEVVSKNSPLFFESSGDNATLRTYLIPAIENEPLPVGKIMLTNPEGAIKVNNAAPAALELQIGDYIETGEDSSAQVAAQDGTSMTMAEETGFVLKQGGNFELVKGNLEVRLPQNGSALFTAGTSLTAASGRIRLRMSDGGEIVISAGANFTLPKFEKAAATVKSVSGTSRFMGAKRDFVRGTAVHAKAGERVHALSISRIIWDSSGSAQGMSLSKEFVLTVPDSFSDGIDIKVESGAIEIIRSETGVQQPASGMLVDFGDKLHVNSGAAAIAYTRGGTASLKPNDIYELSQLPDLDNPVLKIDLEPGFYFGKVYAFDSAGNLSTGSEKVLMAPQVCGDGTAPVANIGGKEFIAAVGKTLILNASKSFDAEGKVISYWLDANLGEDADGDGDAKNDRDLSRDADPASDKDSDGNSENDADDAVFTVGPYSEVGKRSLRLTVRDEALNEGYQDFVINVVAPRIVLDNIQLRSGVLAGFIDPADKDVPITFARLRKSSKSGWEVIKTPSADSGGQYYTDNNGKFNAGDLDMRQRLVVRNNEGTIAAEINEKTGRITILDDRYETRVVLSKPTTRIGIFEKQSAADASPLTFVYFVPDINVDAAVDGESVIYDAAAGAKMSGVHVKPFAQASIESIAFKSLPADDQKLPGAVIIEKSGAQIAAIDATGDIILDSEKLAVREKQFEKDVNENQPVIFELLYENKLIAEIFISVNMSGEKKIEIVDAASELPRRIPVKQAQKVSGQPFSDIAKSDGSAKNDGFGKTAAKLFRRGIIAGYPSDIPNQLLFKPQNPIARSEFTQITLKMLCIVPREEAKKLPSPFYDTLDEKQWFYPAVKEGSIRGFIKGYLGETKKDAATGQMRAPFKPAANITWAEAATVVLAALQEQDIIDLSKVNLASAQGEQWYDPYIKVAQNLTPYLKDNPKNVNFFLITKEEAAQATKPISRKDFAVMAERVLLVRDCYAVGGIFDANKNGIDDDKEALEQAGAGGTGAVEEVQPEESQLQFPQAGVGVKEGIYVLRPACSICPCRASIGEGADLQTGDIIFAAITGKGGIPIYTKSNEETY